MGRIGKIFAALRARGEAALIPFITAGDPNLAATLKIMRALARGGADTGTAGGAGGLSSGAAVNAARGMQMQNVYSLKLKDTIVGEFIDHPIVPGLTFGWAPKASGMIAFADKDGGRLVLMDYGGKKQRVEGTRAVVLPGFSEDGSRIAYQSTATNLVAGDTIANLEVFVTEFAFTGATKSAGTQIEDAHPLNRLSMSFNGERVAYMSIDAQIVPGDTNRTYDAFVHDFTSDVTQRISVDTYLQQAPFGGSTPHLSGDGRFVAFATGSASGATLTRSLPRAAGVAPWQCCSKSIAAVWTEPSGL